MKNTFQNFIKTAKVKQKFYSIDGTKYVLRKIGKKVSIANEYSLNGDQEEVEYQNDDRGMIIYGWFSTCMVKELKQSILIKLLPSEKFWEVNDTKHDQLIILGWNMYREALLERLKLI